MKRLIFAVVFAVAAVVFVSGCGGGGGGGGAAAPVETGSVSGYAYAPIGGAGRAAAAPAGYQPLSGATVTCSGVTTTTNSNGYYVLTGIPVGERTLTISKTGFGTVTRTVAVSANATTVATAQDSVSGAMTLSTSGSVSVTTSPAGASIYIDGATATLTTPTTLAGLSVGEHTIYVTLNGYLGAAQTVTVTNGGTASVSLTLNQVSTGGDQRFYAAINGTDPGAVTGPAPTQATDGEKAAMYASETGQYGISSQCSISDRFGSMWRSAVDVYNETGALAPFASAGIDMVRAEYSTSFTDINTSAISVFGCSDPVFNAFAAYKTAVFHDLLVSSMVEVTALAFMVDSVDEYDYYLSTIMSCAAYGIEGCVVSDSALLQLAEDQATYDAWNQLFTESILFFVGHEMGHANMGHLIEGWRSAANPNSLESILEYPLSNYQEWQADIFGSRFVEQSGFSENGPLLSMYMIYVATNNTWSESHPAADTRLWVISSYFDGGVNYAVALQPVLDNPPFARLAGRRGATGVGGLLRLALEGIN